MSAGDEVYLRDCSWYAHSRGGSAGRYHWPHPTRSAMSACGRVMIQDDLPGLDPRSVADHLRCQAAGCRSRYLKDAERAAGATP